MTSQIAVPCSIGDLIDRITILELKVQYFSDTTKRSNASHELAVLSAVRDQHDMSGAELSDLTGQLKAVNQQLWDIEEEIRTFEETGHFGERFIELARAVYITNDRRSAIKKDINILMKSDLIEEKSY